MCHRVHARAHDLRTYRYAQECTRGSFAKGSRFGDLTDGEYNCKCRRPDGSALPHTGRFPHMAKTPTYRTSNKPALWAGGSEVASTIAPPMKYRAPDNTYETTRGAKLYKKRGGTLATRVVKRSFTPAVKVVNVRDNVWREGL